MVQQKIRLFSPPSPIEFVAINISGPSPKAKGENKYFGVITDRYSELTKAIPTSMTRATAIPNTFEEHLVATFEIPSTVLTDKGLQCTSKFIGALCRNLGAKKVTMTEYHRQANGLVKYFDAVMIPRLRHYVAEPQKD